MRFNARRMAVARDFIREKTEGFEDYQQGLDNALIAPAEQDLDPDPASSSASYYDCMVNIRRVRENV